MELGTLLVKLSADTQGFTKGLSEASKKAEDFSKVAKKIAGDLGQVGVAATAFGGAMLALAATVDGKAKKSLDGLKESTTLVAVQVADILTPAIETLSRIMTSVADVIASMSPELQAQVSHFAEIAAVVGVAGLAFQKLATVGEIFFSIAKSGFLLITPGVAAFVVALAAVLAVVAVIIDNWGTFSGAFNTAVKFMSELWDDFVSGMKTMWDWVIGAIAGGLDALGFDSVADKMKKALNSDSLAGTLKSIASDVATVAGDALTTAVDSVKRGMSKALDFMKAEAKGFGFDFEATKGKARLPSGLPPSAKLAATPTIATPRAAATTTPKPLEVKESKDLSQAFSIITSKMGELGGVINSIAQGAQAGGVWGALLAAIMEIVSRMKGFTDLLETAMSLIYTLAESLEPILTPVFDFLKEIFSAIGTIFKDLAPLWKLLGAIISTLLEPLRWFLRAITDIVDFIQGWKHATEKAVFEDSSGKPAFGKIVKATDSVADSMNNLNNVLSESLTNIPKGVKVALARFNATAESSVGAGAYANEAPYSVGPVIVNAASGKQLWDELVGIAKGEADLRVGNSASIMRALKGA